MFCTLNATKVLKHYIIVIMFETGDDLSHTHIFSLLALHYKIMIKKRQVNTSQGPCNALYFSFGPSLVRVMLRLCNQ